jgi:tetratricopeptide (TPR) repeat protein
MASTDELWETLQQAEDMPYGSAQIALVERVMREVDQAGDPYLAFFARLTATTAYVYGGEPAKSFVTFSWCVADFDSNPQPYHQRLAYNLLWQFKAMVNALTQFPEIPLARTYAVLDDMERRYREGGYGLQAVHKHRYLVAEHIGLTDEADAWYERWQAAPRDQLSDCAGCDPSDVAEYLSSRGRYADAVAHAEPVLSGRLSCSEQPQTILNELMVPYLRTGREQEAADAHRRAYRLQRGMLADLAQIGTHVEFCARTGNEHRGLEILQRHLDWLEKAPSPSAEMLFAASGALVLRRLTELGHGDTVVHRRDREDSTAAALAAELAGRATGLAARFDVRNGTDRQGRRIAELIAAAPYGTPLNLSPVARAAAVAAPPPVEPEPLPEIPAEAGPAELLDLARHQLRADRNAALSATLDALDARFPELSDPEPADPLLAGRRAVLRGDELRNGDRQGVLELWQRAAELFTAAGADDQLSIVRARAAMERAFAGEVDPAPIEADAAYGHADPADRANAWTRVSALRYLQGRHAEAVTAADQAHAYADASGEPSLIAMVALVRARGLAEIDRIDDARAAAGQAWAYHREQRPGPRRGEVAAVYAQFVEDPAEQVTLFGEALAGGAEGAALAARIGRGRALIRLDRAGDAVADLVEAVNICVEQDLPEAAAFARHELATAYHLAGRPLEAAEVAEEALLLLESLELAGPADEVRFLLAGLHREIGDTEGALRVYRELLGRLDEHPGARGQVGEQAGGLLFDLDRDAEAAECLQAAAEALHEAGDVIGELRVLRRLIGALHYADQPEAGEKAIWLAAERFSALPAELAAEPNAIWQRAMTAFEAARLRMSRGRHAEALPDLRDAPARLRAIGATDDADRLDGMLGEALLRSGSPVEAEALLRGLLTRMAEDAPGREVVARVHAEAVETAGAQPKRSFLRRRPDGDHTAG